MFKTVELSSFSDCNGVVVQDELDAFKWECIESAGNVRAHSYFLKEDKGLSDLIDGNNKIFKNNKVKVYKDSNLAGESTMGVWWNNNIFDFPDSSVETVTVPSDSTQGNIYILNANTSGYGYNIAQDKTSLVVMPGVIYTHITAGNNCNNALGGITSPDTRCLITTSGGNYLWFEGEYKGSTADYGTMRGFNLKNLVHSEFRKFKISRTWLGAVTVGGSTSYANRFINLKIVGPRNNGHGISSNSPNSIFYDLQIAYKPNTPNQSGIGVSGDNVVIQKLKLNNIGDTGDYSAACYLQGNDQTVSKILITNSDGALRVSAGKRRATIHNSTIANNEYGMALQNSATHITLVNSLFLNNNLGITDLANGDSSNYHNVALFDHTGISLGIKGNNSKVTGHLITDVPGGIDICQSLSGSTAIATSTCTTSGIDGSNDYPVGSLSTAFHHYSDSAGLSSTVLNFKTFIDDSNNISDSNGLSGFSYANDWFEFDSWFKAYGKDGSAYPNADHQGACTTGSCRIWDYRINTSNSLIQNNTLNYSSLNSAFTPGLSCPDAVHGNQVITDHQTNPNTFLFSAIEILFDNQGDDDGLCESNEACIYSPNFGAYQGFGDYLANGSCLFLDGVVSGVTMYAYPNN